MGKTIFERFGENVRKIRESRKLSQGVLARMLGVDKSYMSHLESGRKNPTLKTTEKLAKILKVSPEKLLT